MGPWTPRPTTRGAHWHTAAEIRALLGGFPVQGVRLRTAVFLPSGGTVARLAERLAPNVLPWGAFIAVAGWCRL